MAAVIRERLQTTVNVPDGEMPQFTAALGCAVLGHIRLQKLKQQDSLGSFSRQKPAEIG
ncbi:hypothetical protein GWO43_28615 [candidate division KSB1 bacterium]|nr:hypothetical protein [candidate division KSB1 bacterium]NIS27870.1 hypothetical protein [candidate division KSB1 bacterium]NIT74753.1 hypothetical protein [candidate division KSB1 bacterium]NIU26665.1 hypothetical protein [candidate division KSB1 bacterium]NIW20537.1 hypothetical protein [candidate division KSB1 bacterium]